MEHKYQFIETRWLKTFEKALFKKFGRQPKILHWKATFLRKAIYLTYEFIRLYQKEKWSSVRCEQFIKEYVISFFGCWQIFDFLEVLESDMELLFGEIYFQAT